MEPGLGVAEMQRGGFADDEPFDTASFSKRAEATADILEEPAIIVEPKSEMVTGHTVGVDTYRRIGIAPDGDDVTARGDVIRAFDFDMEP